MSVLGVFGDATYSSEHYGAIVAEMDVERG